MTSTLTSTITITTTIAYKPSLIPGDSKYTLIGCYSQPTGNGGRIFGADEHDACSDKVPPDNLTIDGCLEGCGSSPQPSNRTKLYIYVGLINGSECVCGTQLSADAHRLSDDDCRIPCSGDPRFSCGGQDNVAVYSLISGSEASSQRPQSASESGKSAASKTASLSSNNTFKLTTGTTTSNEHSTPSVKTDDKSKGAASQTTNTNDVHHSTLPPSAGPGAPPKPVSTPTIAAITGSFSGAVVVAAGLFLCIRAYKRKKRTQDLHVKAMVERRGRAAPSPIVTTADIHNITNNNIIISKHKKGDTKDGGREDAHDKDLRLTADGDLVPTTPALESGEKNLYVYPGAGGLHARASGTRAGADGRDTLYSTLMGEMRSGPSNLHSTHAHVAGASSAVQWRSNGGSVPSTPYAAHNRTASSGGVAIAAPPPSAKVESLGERAWHRRKLSTPYQPPQGVGLGISIGAAAESGSEVGRGGGGFATGSLARGSPPSGPPNMPLPPTPLPKPGTRARSRSRSQSRSGVNVQGNEESMRMNPPPLRPRRSFDTVAFEPEPGYRHGEQNLSLAPGAGSGGGNGNVLGMSHANTSTPSLGRYGSISKTHRPTVDYMESPILGRQLSIGRDQWAVPPDLRGKPRRVDTLADRQPTIPVLPPVAPGERFDHKSWRGSIYGVSNEKDRQRGEGDERSPVSASSVGTSILFSPQEFDRRL
ncbi:hypothetical protein F5Y19DRAFT_487286 [Xylariaceae sp. FL1651]|nr:hypothetical protein F5Y19DRAFT_487286 [Xylariaceae sp. FL1651]